MLVLTRRPGEALRIGSDVRISIVSATTRQVRIAIEAPDDVSIHREEVYDRIAAANVEAAKISTLDFELLHSGVPNEASTHVELDNEG